MAGIRFYFGNHDKTLIRRQREDDPPALSPFEAEAKRICNNSEKLSQGMLGVPVYDPVIQKARVACKQERLDVEIRACNR